MTAMKPQQGRIGVVLQAGQEKAPMPRDRGKQRVAEIAQIEQQESPLDPLTGAQNRTIVNPLGGDFDPVRPLAADIENRVQLHRSQGVIGAAGRPISRQGIVETDDGGIHAQDLPNLTQHCRRPFGATVQLLQAHTQQLAEKPRQGRGEAVVELAEIFSPVTFS